MQLSIKKNDKPDLTICKMKCDNLLHEKLEYYELTSFMNAHCTNLLIGKPKSGKTALIYSFFKSKFLFKKIFTKIFIFQPSASRGSMSDNIFGQLPEEQIFDELSYDNLKSVIDVIKTEDPSHKLCIIMDDMTAYLKNKETLQLLKELIFNRRHLHVSVFFLVQTWKSVEKDIRKLFNNIFIFKVSKQELEDIGEEVIERDKKLLPLISKLVYNEPYKYIFLNTESQRMFSGFDEIIFDS